MNNSRKTFVFLGLATVAAWAVAQGTKLGALDQHVSQLNKAGSLQGTLNIRAVDGSSDLAYTVLLSKPNKAMISSPAGVTVADGTTITVFNRSENSFYKMPQTTEEFSKLFSASEMQLVAPFFSPDSFKGVKVKSTATKKRKGEEMTAVALTVDPAGQRTATYYVDGGGVARQLELTNGDARTLIDTDGMTLSANPVDASKFAFTAPEGAKEVSWAEMNSAKWFTDLEEAKKVAAATGKLILIDFYTDWCHWCKVLDANVFPTETFRQTSKNFVFAKIDAEKREDISGPFKIEGYPTAIITRADGTTEVHRIVGYKEAAAYVADMNKAIGK